MTERRPPSHNRKAEFEASGDKEASSPKSKSHAGKVKVIAGARRRLFVVEMPKTVAMKKADAATGARRRG
jgi:hypothetical protein